MKIKKLYSGSYEILINGKKYELEKQANGWSLECEQWEHEKAVNMFPFERKSDAIDFIKQENQ